MVLVKTVSILDNTAAHLPNLFCKGDRNNLNLNKIIVTDHFIHLPLKNNHKFAWLVEPECVFNHSYNYIKSNHNQFEKVFTHDKSVLDTISNSIFMPFGTTFIEEKDFSIYAKTKLVSMVASNKNFTPGHSFRLNILNSVRNKVDCFGRGINPVEYKLDCLKNYRFSIAIENSKHDYWFTEKLLDCFLTGTIPIYWGCPSIGKFFDINGIICFDTLDDLSNILNNLSIETYYDKMESIKINFQEAKKYLNPYDDVYQYCESL